MKNQIKIFALTLLLFCSAFAQENYHIKIGSKKFTESVIIGEIAKDLGKKVNANVEHLKELGGTRVLWDALLKGDIDIYPEYTGTIKQEIFSGKVNSDHELFNSLKKLKIKMSSTLGFNDTYAIGMKINLAKKLNIEKISDLKNHPDLKIGFSNEFMDRKDGWPGLKRAYNLSQKDVRGLDHDLAYRGLESGDIDVIDLYSTDAEIDYYNLKVLKDDKNFFPEYKAVFLYRADLAKKAPETLQQILNLENSITEASMIKMNEEVKIGGKTENNVASEFVKSAFGIKSIYQPETIWDRLIKNTKQHLFLVSVSLMAAILLSIPLGIIAFRKKKFGNMILSVVGIIQTIPSLALLVFMIPLLGIGSWPAIVALFLYSLLPIVRNTYSGLQDIPENIRESASAIGLPDRAKLRLIELPLASRSILSGIKTSAVINVGTATLGALIGAGGYGQPILTGIRLDNVSLILEGAIPAAVLALLVQGLFDLLENVVVPKGLRIKSN
jgi:osmoprotectant transport system permease protein